jgi:hypothetical protein
LNIYRNPSETDENINLGNLTVQNGGSIVAYGSTTMANIDNGGTAGNPYGKGPTLMGANITVDAGASINADGTGFAAGAGPGKGRVLMVPLVPMVDAVVAGTGQPMGQSVVRLPLVLAVGLRPLVALSKLFLQQ